MLLMAGLPSMLVITSSGRNPAVAAGPPADTAWTNSPSGTPAWAAAAGGIGVVCTPKKAWATRPVAMISRTLAGQAASGWTVKRDPFGPNYRRPGRRVSLVRRGGGGPPGGGPRGAGNSESARA